MSENPDGAPRAFNSFRALDSTADAPEREKLFRNMAQLFTYVSDRCDDDQVEQYDEVLCQLAGLVEVEARSDVAKLLAPLQRAPGTVVVKLAKDEIEVARPLLEFSNVLNDDDLIEIVEAQTEEHRVTIAGRVSVTNRVGHAIVDHGQDESLGRLAENNGADLKSETLSQLVEKAVTNDVIAQKLRSRKNVDWDGLAKSVSGAAQSVVSQLSAGSKAANGEAIAKASALAFNRLQSSAGFSATEWNIAWNQIKALSDRRQLDDRAIARFARFSYGHQLGAALTLMLGLRQEVFVKWLATQDYRALAVACRSLGLASEIFERALQILPWREVPTADAIEQAVSHFERLDPAQAGTAFDTWRMKATRKQKVVQPLTEQMAS